MIAGKIARNAKKATPPARMRTLSAVLSANALRVTCHQPVGGICVGAPASPPGRDASPPSAPVGCVRSFAPTAAEPASSEAFADPSAGAACFGPASGRRSPRIALTATSDHTTARPKAERRGGGVAC